MAFRGMGVSRSCLAISCPRSSGASSRCWRARRTRLGNRAPIGLRFLPGSVSVPYDFTAARSRAAARVASYGPKARASSAQPIGLGLRRPRNSVERPIGARYPRLPRQDTSIALPGGPLGPPSSKATSTARTAAGSSRNEAAYTTSILSQKQPSPPLRHQPLLQRCQALTATIEIGGRAHSNSAIVACLSLSLNWRRFNVSWSHPCGREVVFFQRFGKGSRPEIAA